MGSAMEIGWFLAILAEIARPRIVDISSSMIRETTQMEDGFDPHTR
jgi:hypothetical protein